MSGSVMTRLVNKGDLPVVGAFVDLLAKALAEDGIAFQQGVPDDLYDAYVSQLRSCAILAEDDSGPLGLVTVSFNLALRYAGEYAQVEELIVNEAARGKKVGSVLMQAAVQAARARGCAEIGLYAVERNRPFYQKMGFTYAGPEMRMTLLDPNRALRDNSAHGPG